MMALPDATRLKYKSNFFDSRQWRNYYYTTTVLWPSGFCPGLPGWASTRKVKPKPIWISWSKRQWVAVVSAGSYAMEEETEKIGAIHG